MDSIVSPKVGLQTGDNNKFLRQWFEVNNSKISYHSKSIADSLLSGKKWFPLNKGGSYRKWYGNYDYVVNWENDGYEMKHFCWPNGKQRSVIRNPNYYFREAITWSDITSGDFSIRYRKNGSIHETSGMSAFDIPEQSNLIYILGLMNSKVSNYVLKIINPTIHLKTGNFAQFPVLKSDLLNIDSTVKRAIEIAKIDWDSQEISWNFCENDLIRNKLSTIESSVIAENNILFFTFRGPPYIICNKYVPNYSNGRI
ncbi:hypothetical protein [Companilactobacillus hulinensis]|uniref:hypothetical protein n=1 Tax=Companilactobacillus hulinensis TaxID=2486007 RepID=UPI000F7A9C92|nr:hypothetical protein [Companilactobacillus hulinensis]